MKKITCMLSCLFLWLQYSFWFGKHGVCDFFRIKNNVAVKVIDDLRIEFKRCNDKFIFEINDFINHQEASVEECARNELGLIKSDEDFYHVIIMNK